MKPITGPADVDSSILHYERTPGRSACGRNLPTAGYFTDDLDQICQRTGSRCGACWRSMVARGEVKAEDGWSPS